MEPKVPHKPFSAEISQQMELPKISPLWVTSLLKVHGYFGVALGIFMIAYPSFEDFSLDSQALSWRFLGIYAVASGLNFIWASQKVLEAYSSIFFSFSIKFFSVFLVVYGYIWAELSQPFFNFLLAFELIWLPFWVPMVWWIFREKQNSSSHSPALPLEIAMNQFRTNRGSSLWHLTMETPVMLVFLRHFGCTFCRETLMTLAEKLNRKELDINTKLVFVHMSSEEEAAKQMSRYGLEKQLRISDKTCELYRAFDLQRGSLRQVFGLKSWLRGIKLLFKKGVGAGMLMGDGFRMPGVFLVFEGKVIREYRHRSVADVAPFEYLSACRVSDL